MADVVRSQKDIMVTLKEFYLEDIVSNLTYDYDTESTYLNDKEITEYDLILLADKISTERNRDYLTYLNLFAIALKVLGMINSPKPNEVIDEYEDKIWQIAISIYNKLEYIKISSILEELQIKSTRWRSEQQAIAKVLKSKGFIKKHTKEGNVWILNE